MGTAFEGAPTYFLLRLGGVGLVFLLCLWLAFRRARYAAPDSRARGIVLAALVPMAGYPLYFGALGLIVAPILFVWVAYFVIAWIALPAIASAIVADVALRLLGAKRTTAWLLAGIATAVAITLAWFLWFFGGLPPLAIELAFEVAMIALVPVSSALAWWAYLPPAGQGVAEAFE